MKKTLFGSLGDMIKGNALMIILGICVVAAGAMSFYTVNDINNKLKQQQIENPNPPADVVSDEQTQEVQKEAEKVPLRDKPSDSEKTEPENRETVTPAEDIAIENTDAEAAKPRFVLPVNGKIFAAFSGNELVYNKTMDDWRTHNGIDIRANRDTAVKASSDGTVTNVYSDGMLGTVVEIDSGDYIVRYCGLGSNLLCEKGKNVKQGDTIGVVGEIPLETGEESHIHLEVIKNGVAVNPDELLK